MGTRIRGGRVAAAVGGILIALVTSAAAPSAASAATAAAAAPSAVTPASIPPGVQAQLETAPAHVQSWVRGVAEKGGKIEKLSRTAYKLKAKAGAATVTPDALPSGCGLWVLLVAPSAYTGGALESDNLTDCTGHGMEQEIEMDSGIAVREYGEDFEIASDYDNNHLVEYFTMNYQYGCHGVSNNWFTNITTGYVTTLSGDHYEADAYDGGYYDCTV